MQHQHLELQIFMRLKYKMKLQWKCKMKLQWKYKMKLQWKNKMKLEWKNNMNLVLNLLIKKLLRSVLPEKCWITSPPVPVVSASMNSVRRRETHPDLPPLNQGTISKIEAQYREMGHVRKVPSKRQAVVDDDTKLNLLLALEENPITPARQLARDSNLNHKTSYLKMIQID
ncbi:hypothetical protein NQ318_003131 [Aromia moschata]|uniref:Uncharacterized protein n=1 Tax=Aromia moschata TaxID=1265417 RepID=A0AAV8YUB2_9CUCU|nr:hypothetical protein NQ318_003131 [Aromia moschata]